MNNIQAQNNLKNKKVLIFIIILIIILIIGIIVVKDKLKNNEVKEGNIVTDVKYSPYRITSNSIELFDFAFLQLNQEKQNKVYSPISIKYTLEMLAEGANGETKNQITNIIGNYKYNKYTNSKNVSFANAIFINDLYKNNIKDSYINALKEKYNADVIADSFENPTKVNSWISNKTLKLINNILDDVSDVKILFINALAIDMDWENKFINANEKFQRSVIYGHENFSWNVHTSVISSNFQDMNEEISGMEIIASFNNYDIIKELGEEKIRKIVKDAYLKYIEENKELFEDFDYSLYITGNIEGLSKSEIKEKYIEEYIDNYIEEISSNYRKEDMTTDFSFYTDDKIKVFAKDLKEYDGLNLQYIAIMPNEDLNNYINNINVSDLNNVINNLKELKVNSFKDGVVTKINGFIPKFKFEYELNLTENLKKLGITDIFDEKKVNFENMTTDKSLVISNTLHKANIELTQDGIKAAATTVAGGYGSGEDFDYLFDVPVEEIDLTFDKPYMFIIIDKKTKEVWFAGTVYNPLLFSSDTTKTDELK